MLYLDSLPILNKEELFDLYPEIFRVLTKFYPIGYHYESEKFQNHLSTQLVQKLIKEKIENKENLKLWQDDFCSILSKSVGLQVIGATFGVSPAYGAKIIIEENLDRDLTIELHIKLSLLGHFYSIQIGYINSRMKMKSDYDYLDDITGYGLEKLVISPIDGHYGDIFMKVENSIREYFQDGIFLPYKLDITRLSGLTTYYNEMVDSPIGMAFFRNFMPINYYKPPELLGNPNYMIEKLTKN
ncbi:MAG: hypothetical protein JKX82_00545 [Oleispira sp.]|nr:hypothetical protein [Oleispira sp.]